MAMERDTGAAPAMQPTTQSVPHDLEHLPTLFGRLGDDVMRLLDTKLNLVKVEMRDEAAAYAKDSAGIGVGAILATVGLVLINVAVAFFVSTLFNFSTPQLNYAVGFLLTSLIYLIVGGAIIMVMKNRMMARNPLPERSIQELRKDKQWLKNEI
jgi:uncharacterized membrane protein YqjE